VVYSTWFTVSVRSTFTSNSFILVHCN